MFAENSSSTRFLDDNLALYRMNILLRNIKGFFFAIISQNARQIEELRETMKKKEKNLFNGLCSLYF